MADQPLILITFRPDIFWYVAGAGQSHLNLRREDSVLAWQGQAEHLRCNACVCLNKACMFRCSVADAPYFKYGSFWLKWF